MAFQMRPISGWGWLVFGSITSILLYVLILVQWSGSGLFAIGLFVAIDLFVDGWSCIFFAPAARPAGRGCSATTEPTWTAIEPEYSGQGEDDGR